MSKPRARFFYGWVIVGVIGVTGALAMALGTLNFGLFIKPMGDELGIGRSLFGWAFTARQVSGALTAPLVGSLVDRYGARWLLAAAAAITGGCLAALGYIHHGWQLVVLFALMGLVGMTGPGAIVMAVPVAKWFVRKRGRAMAFASLGTPIGGVLFVPLSQVFINGLGWRHAWIVLAGIGGGLIIPLALLFMKRQPEDMGLAPDGDPGPAASVNGRRAVAKSRAAPEVSWTAAEAARSPTFWKLAAIFSIVMLAIGTVSIHRIPYFMDRGLDPDLVSYATALDAAMAGVGMFLVGLVVERLRVRYLGTAAFVMIAVAVFLTIAADRPALMFLATGAFGFGIGMHLLLMNYLWADYFGRAHLGAIRGLVNPLTLVIGGLGAPLSGYVRDATGTYNPMWWTGIVLLSLGAVILASTPPPRRKPAIAAPRAAAVPQASGGVLGGFYPLAWGRMIRRNLLGRD